MSNSLTIAQLQDAKALITGGDITGFYLYLANQGYGYANLANEMVTGYGTAGNAAQNYMVARASEQGITLTAPQITQIEIALANGYVDTLIANASATGSVSLDVTFQEALAFHTQGFADNNLGPQTWTLYMPGQILGEAKMESLWPNLIDPTAIFPGWTSLAIEMGSVWWNGSPADSAAAGQWLGNVADAVTFGSSPAIPDPLRFLLPFMFDSSSLSGGDPSVTIDSFSVSLGGDADVVGLADSYAELSIPLSSTIDVSSDGSGAAQASANAQARQTLYDLWLDTLQSVQTLNPNSTVTVSMHNSSGNQMQVQVASSATGQVTKLVNTTVDGVSANVVFEFDEAGNTFLQSVTSINGAAPANAGSLIEALNAAGITPAALMHVNAGAVLTAYDATNPANNPNNPVNNSQLGVVVIELPEIIVTPGESPTDTAQEIQQGWLIKTGTHTVSMNPADVNEGSTGDAGALAASNIVTDGYRPGNFNLATSWFDPLLNVLDAVGNFFDGLAQDITTAFTNVANFLTKLVSYTDPVVLDLNGDGVKLTNYTEQPVLFDIDHDGGSVEVTGWVSAEDGILVHDLNSNGVIDNISETLSEYYNGTVGTGGEAGEKLFANGFEALKSLDSNLDNVFTSADASWNSLRVWVDANSNGKTDAGELKTFAQLGVTQINLTNQVQSGEVRDGNEVLARGTFVQNGQTKEAIAARFLAHPNGTTFSPSGTGTIAVTEGNVTSYVSNSATGETIDVAAKGVKNAYGAQGNDILIGDANSNWLAGGVGSDTFNAGAGDDVLMIDADDLQSNIHAGADLRTVRNTRRTMASRRPAAKWNHSCPFLTHCG